jgi:peptide chain release factor 1
MDPGSLSATTHPFCETDVTLEWFGGTTGAGGQHRNKHQNAARVVHVPSGIARTAQTRSRKASLAAAMSALKDAVECRERSLMADRSNAERRNQISTDRCRTYRFQDGRVTDHRTGQQAKLADVMAGRFDLLR